jgi:hypothetical protein
MTSSYTYVYSNNPFNYDENDDYDFVAMYDENFDYATMIEASFLKPEQVIYLLNTNEDVYSKLKYAVKITAKDLQNLKSK